MRDTRLHPDLTVPDLGLAAGFGLFGFRACALGYGRCCAVVHGFDRALGHDAPAALAGMAAFARSLGVKGHRRINLNLPGCVGVTLDELNVVGALAAAQADEAAERDRRLAGLFGGPVDEAAAPAVDQVSSAFAVNGLWIRRPPIAAATTRDIDLRAVAPAGSA
ncbi:MAG: hypothetical protein MI723_19505 [Caulobacterales bacterium]|nr:hypothetical protein [Caulobacterales bacterium]